MIMRKKVLSIGKSNDGLILRRPQCRLATNQLLCKVRDRYDFCTYQVVLGLPF